MAILKSVSVFYLTNSIRIIDFSHKLKQELFTDTKSFESYNLYTATICIDNVKDY